MGERIRPYEMVGKTIEEVHDGYETLRITFEDGTEYSVTTYTGNPRDL